MIIIMIIIIIIIIIMIIPSQNTNVVDGTCKHP